MIESADCVNYSLQLNDIESEFEGQTIRYSIKQKRFVNSHKFGKCHYVYAGLLDNYNLKDN